MTGSNQGNERDGVTAAAIRRSACVSDGRPCECLVGSVAEAHCLEAPDANDPDYSPAYQDEYQRLWHQAAADAERLRNLSGALLKLQTERGLGRFFPDELPLMDELAKAVRENGGRPCKSYDGRPSNGAQQDVADEGEPEGADDDDE